jgi:prolyl-tRNA synthetase
MKTSKFFIATLKEVPAEAEIASHRLMLRASLIRRLSAGIYTWLPLGVRVLRKVEAIVRAEMDRAGAVELAMPVVQPAELWQESGRWQAYGPELLRFKDRHERDFVIQPTSEEAITDLARAELKSYRRMPAHFYHDHLFATGAPRFGITHGREFVMKPGYSFHASYEDAAQYRNMYDTYTRIFTRSALEFRAVAVAGMIGGTGSQEFHVLADSGEDAITFCPRSRTTPPTSSLPGLTGHARCRRRR